MGQYSFQDGLKTDAKSDAKKIRLILRLHSFIMSLYY